MRTTVTDEGLTTVPARIRRDHGIDPGTEIQWIDDGHSFRVIPIPPNPARSAPATRAETAAGDPAETAAWERLLEAALLEIGTSLGAAPPPEEMIRRGREARDAELMGRA